VLKKPFSFQKKMKLKRFEFSNQVKRLDPDIILTKGRRPIFISSFII